MVNADARNKTDGRIRKEGPWCGMWGCSPCGGRDNHTHAHLAFLDGNNIREPAQHPGPICKHRNFWLITAMKRAKDHALKTTSEHKSCLVFPVLMIISILFSTCKLRKWPSDSGFLYSLTAHTAPVAVPESTSVGHLAKLKAGEQL